MLSYQGKQNICPPPLPNAKKMDEFSEPFIPFFFLGNLFEGKKLCLIWCEQNMRR